MRISRILCVNVSLEICYRNDRNLARTRYNVAAYVGLHVYFSEDTRNVSELKHAAFD